MNDGKICISLSSRSIRELAGDLARADHLADVIEIRFDLLENAPVDDVVELLRHTPLRSRLLATARPSEEQSSADPKAFTERISFWRTILESKVFDLIDLEDDLVFALTYNDILEPELFQGVTIIGSQHNFFETPPDLGPMLKPFEPAESFKCDIVKIATTAHSITDTVEQWYLLDWAKHYGAGAVPISMGEPGKWTRVLGLAHGAAMTYASLGAGVETAPGQVSATDLIDVYRVKELDRDTDVYGVIAGDTSYSMSPYIQNAAFMAAGLNSVFLPLQVDDLQDFVKKMVRRKTREIDLNFKGFAVTNPHKQSIMALLDDVDETARAIGAVNTVTVDGERLIGTNTDAAGFIEPLQQRLGKLKGIRAIVAGSGGAARACVYALKTAGAIVTLAARDAAKAEQLAREFDVSPRDLNADHSLLEADIIVNATPVGTSGLLNEKTIVQIDQLVGIKVVYDLTYNPRETRLLRDARDAGCETLDGLEMLIAQGAKQFEIWTGQTPDSKIMLDAALKRLSDE